MNVLQVNKFLYRRGGAESYVLDLARAQVQKGYRVALFGTKHPQNEHQPFELHFPSGFDLERDKHRPSALIAGASRSLYSTAARQGIEAVVDAFKPDVVHLHNIYHHLSPSILAPLEKRGIPVVMTLHDYKLICPTYRLFDNANPCSACSQGHYYKALLKKCKQGSAIASGFVAAEQYVHARTHAYSSIKLLICPSRYLLKKMQPSIPNPGRLRHVSHFVDADISNRRDSYPVPRGQLLYVGRLSPEKGVDRLLMALALVPSDVRLTIVGDGPSREEVEHLAREYCPDRVDFLGHLPPEGVKDALARSTVLVLPSRSPENLPLVLLEAFACGVPVIATRLGGSQEIVQHAVDGYLVPPESINALARAITELALDPSAAARMGDAGRRKVRSREFSLEHHLDVLEGLYREAGSQDAGVMSLPRVASDLSPSSQNRPTTEHDHRRLGLLVDQPNQPRWITRVIDMISSISSINTTAVVLPKPVARFRSPGRKRFQGFGFVALYYLLDRLLFGRHDDALTMVDLREALPQLACIQAELDGSRLSYDAEEAIRAETFDVLLDLRPVAVHIPNLPEPRGGVWRYSITTENGSNVLEEALGRTGRVLRVRLIQTREGKVGKVLAESFSGAHPVSIRKTMSQLLWKAAAFPTRVLLRDGREPSYGVSSSRSSEGKRRTPAYDASSSRLLWHTARRAGAEMGERLSSETQWWIACLRRSDSGLVLPSFLRPPAGMSWSDPFPVFHHGDHFIFIEEVPTRGAQRGHISVVRIRRDGRWDPPVVVLDRSTHLSYPSILRHRNELFMVPESAETRSVDLYRCVDFPFRWELEAQLLQDVRAVDSTLLMHGGKWWMFTNVAEDGASVQDELRLFSSRSLHGPWRENRTDPVKSDVRSARSAGRLFWSKGELYRPSQDSSARYGRALVLNRVTVLSDSAYEEVQVGRIDPWGSRIQAAHTLNITRGLACLDVAVRTPRRLSPVSRRAECPAPFLPRIVSSALEELSL